MCVLKQYVVAALTLLGACEASPGSARAPSHQRLAAFERATFVDTGPAFCHQEPLAGARRQRASGGCAAALSAYRAVAEECAGTDAEPAALWELADCHRIAGDASRAALLFTQVRVLQ